MKKGKILYVTHEADMNGASFSLLDQIKALKKLNYEIYVIIPRNGDLGKALENENVEFTTVCYFFDYRIVGQKHIIRECIKKMVNFIAVYRIAKIINNKSIDIVHSNSTAADVGARAANLTGTKHIWHFREFMELDFGFEYMNKRQIQELFIKSDYNISISDVICKYYLKKYHVKSTRIYNGLDIGKYYIPFKKQKFQKGKISVLFCGTISEGKGVFDIIQAVNILHTKGEDISLQIVGKGSKDYINSISKYLFDNKLTDIIKIFPHSSELSDYRKNNDIAVVCSKMEGLGRVTLESMLSGMCVIGANTGATIEIIGKDEERGYIYKQGNSESLADKILEAYSKKKETVEKIVKSQKYVIENFDNAKYIKHIDEIYSKIMK